MCLQRSGPSLASRGGGGRLDAHTCLALRSLASRASRRLSTPAVIWREPYRLLAAPVEPDVLWKHHFHAAPQLITGPWPFVTSDKIMCASTVESEQRETFVWFPISPSVGLCLMSDGHAGQILGSVVEVNRQSKRVSFAKSPEARWLRCQAPSPQRGSEEFVNTLNRMMGKGSTELYAADRDAMDSALRIAELPTGYRYQPTYG